MKTVRESAREVPVIAEVDVLVISATTEAIGIVRDARGMGWNVPITGWGY